MHGEITLDSSLGSGTTAMFWVPFNKPQYHNGSSTLVDIDSIPDRLRSEMSVSGCSSEQELTNGASPQTSLTTGNAQPHAPYRSGSIDGRSPTVGSASDVELGLPEAERKKVHVLVVEDK